MCQPGANRLSVTKVFLEEKLKIIPVSWPVQRWGGTILSCCDSLYSVRFMESLSESVGCRHLTCLSTFVNPFGHPPKRLDKRELYVFKGKVRTLINPTRFLWSVIIYMEEETGGIKVTWRCTDIRDLLIIKTMVVSFLLLWLTVICRWLKLDP